ncbi:hypothetical protein DFH27DRAFT_607018 [Peziza echinospora]|nr:hypothetical protein DFH27DRAFT_607018 [Peziza echinospora]
MYTRHRQRQPATVSTARLTSKIQAEAKGRRRGAETAGCELVPPDTHTWTPTTTTTTTTAIITTRRLATSCPPSPSLHQLLPPSPSPSHSLTHTHFPSRPRPSPPSVLLLLLLHPCCPLLCCPLLPSILLALAARPAVAVVQSCPSGLPATYRGWHKLGLNGSFELARIPTAAAPQPIISGTEVNLKRNLDLHARSQHQTQAHQGPPPSPSPSHPHHLHRHPPTTSATTTTSTTTVIYSTSHITHGQSIADRQTHERTQRSATQRTPSLAPNRHRHPRGKVIPANAGTSNNCNLAAAAATAAAAYDPA